jgi:hypothetical protein
MTIPHYINEDKSEMRGISLGGGTAQPRRSGPGSGRNASPMTAIVCHTGLADVSGGCSPQARGPMADQLCQKRPIQERPAGNKRRPVDQCSASD